MEDLEVKIKHILSKFSTGIFNESDINSFWDYFTYCTNNEIDKLAFFLNNLKDNFNDTLLMNFVSGIEQEVLIENKFLFYNVLLDCSQKMIVDCPELLINILKSIFLIDHSFNAFITYVNCNKTSDTIILTLFIKKSLSNTKNGTIKLRVDKL